MALSSLLLLLLFPNFVLLSDSNLTALFTEEQSSVTEALSGLYHFHTENSMPLRFGREESALISIG